MRPNQMLPEAGFVRLSTVLQCIPVSRAAWYEGIKAGRYPAPVRLSERTAVYRVEDIRALIGAFSSTVEA